MSIPYLVHKDDAASYDAIRDAMDPLRKEFREAEDKAFCGDPESLRTRIDEVSAKYAPLFDALCVELESKYGKPRVISGLSERPKDLENYYTYFRGYCWDKNPAKSEMLGTIPDWAVKK